MVYRYLKCSSIAMLSWIFYLASGESTSDNCITCHSKSILDCAEVIKPGWTIDKLANVTLDAWPWKCLNSRYNHNSALEKAISIVSPDVYKAASKGYVGFVQYFVDKQDVDLTIPDRNGRTPLQLAIQNKHPRVVKYIAINDLKIACTSNVSILYGSKSGMRTTYGLPSVMKDLISDMEEDSFYDQKFRNETIREAVRTGNLFLLKYLVDEKGFTVEQNDRDFLLLSAAAGNVDLIKYLIYEKKVNVKNDQTFGATTALHEAALAGHLEAVCFFVEIMKYPVDLRCEYGATPTHFAVRGGSLHVLKYLLDEKGANLFATYRLGSTLLHQAAIYGHLKIVKYLVDQKFMSVDSKDLMDKTPLYRAFEAGKSEVIEYLVNEKKATIDSSDGDDLLHIAASQGNLLVVKFLITEMHVSPNVKDASRMTPLHAAARSGNLDVVKYLAVDEKADVNAEDNLGRNLLHQAIFGKNLALVKFVVYDLNMLPRINEVDDEHRTAAMEAAGQGQLTILRFLLDQNCVNTTISDFEGKSLLHYAVKSGVDSLAILKYLIEEKDFDVNTRTSLGENVYDLGRRYNAGTKVLTFLENKLSKLKPVTQSNSG